MIALGASALLARLRRSGYTVAALEDGTKLHIAPSVHRRDVPPLAPELVEQARHAKPALLELLAATGVGSFAATARTTAPIAGSPM